ncbi:MAG: hypothetical protein JJ846_008880 [Prochlorococcus marinus CUG1437]|nr:hypothetical protein [Prochlorococcus marinus CUG1437]
MKLAFRNTKLKIKVAVIADAALGPFPYVDPGNTFDRYLVESNRTPYECMWHTIGAFYSSNQWNGLSNERLEQRCNQLASQGCYELTSGKDINGYSSNHKVIVSPQAIKEASERWIQYGWLNYEEKRADKLKFAGRAAKWTALIAGGGSIFGI